MGGVDLFVFGRFNLCLTDDSIEMVKDEPAPQRDPSSSLAVSVSKSEVTDLEPMEIKHD